MQVWAKRFAAVFGLGLVIYVSAVGVSAATGQPLADTPVIRSLRWLGGGWMLSGMTLWVAKSRSEGGRPGLNPMFGLLLIFSTILLVLGVILTIATGEISLLTLQAGEASSAAALVVGLLAVLIAPGEKQTRYDYPWMSPDFDPNEDAYSAGRVVPTAGYGPEDDLTRIAGVDEQVERALKEAGIRHYTTLAYTSPETLSDILETAEVSDTDPTTWPDQAILAGNGDWEGLAALQAKLAGETEAQPA